MAITNASEVKFVYTSDYNNLSNDNKSTYADAIIFDESARSILLDGKTFGGSASSDNTVLVTKDNWLNPEIWGASATPGSHYIIRDLLTYSGTDTIELELPNNSTIEFLKGAGLGSDDTENTTSFRFKLNHADIISPKQKIFYSSCTLIGFIFNEYIPIEWFGAVGCDETADENGANSHAVFNAFDHAGGGTVLMSDAYYAFTSNIIVPHRIDRYPTLEYEINKGTDISCLRKKLLCLGNIVTTANYTVTSNYINNGSVMINTKAAIAIVHPYTDIEVQGSILISGEIYDDDFAAVAIYDSNAGGYTGNYIIDDDSFLTRSKPNCNIYVNTIVKGVYNKDLTYNNKTMARSWALQQAYNCGTGTGIFIEGLSNSNIKVDNIRGFNKAVDIFCMHNSTLTVSNIICNYGIYVRYTPIISDSASGITNLEPLVTGNTINYNGITSRNISNYMYVPSDPIYTYNETTDPNHMYPTGISGFTMKNDATLFKVNKNCIYIDGVTPVNDTKILFARNTININNLGGFWSKLIDGMWMYNNTFNIKGNYFDAKIIRNDAGTSSDPDPDLLPTYTVTNENTGYKVINSSYCSICNVDEFVTTENSMNNIINSLSLFPYDLATANDGALIINNCTPLENLTSMLRTTASISTSTETGNQIYYNYKSCEISYILNDNLYVIQPSIKPKIFDSSLGFSQPDRSYEGTQLVTTDTSISYGAKVLYPLYECISTEPRQWNNTYYYDEYGLVDTYKINSIVEQLGR